MPTVVDYKDELVSSAMAQDRGAICGPQALRGPLAAKAGLASRATNSSWYPCPMGFHRHLSYL